MLSALGLACVLAQAPLTEPPPSPVPATATAPATVLELPPPAHPARINWALDGAITGGAALTFGILELWVTPQLEPPTVQTPGVPDEVGTVDAIAIGHYIPEAATASDALLITSVATPIILHGIEAGVRRDRVGLRYGTDLMLLGEVMAVDLLLTEILKQPVPTSTPTPTAARPTPPRSSRRPSASRTR